MEKVQLGVIGLGAIGQGLLQQLQAREDVQLSAVCDTQRAVAQRVAQEAGDIPYFTDYQALLANADADLVYVAVPPKYHERIVLDVLQAGKHLLCEKPLANAVDEAKRMKEAANEAGVVHAMHFPLHYQPGLIGFKERLQEGYIGQPRHIRLTMHFPQWPRLWQQNDWVAGREQGGYVLEVGVHWIQAMQSMFGRVTDVQSDIRFPSHNDACETDIIAQMKLEDGTPVLIEGMRDVAGEEHIEFAVYGTEGTLKLLNWKTLVGGKVGEPIEKLTDGPIQKGKMIQELIAAVKGQEAEIYDFNVGYEAQVVLEALRRPQSQGWQTLKYV
ncbi:Gfo/Idh/MocA family protein [Caldalkalibacillus salinus]|uniref:Gfo/Idh/MocA family protein n=1 Tax=Caldalkalibacillus salinus TaxID=2803787 RepID=UPI00192224DB|nr:Gfo/Idh/MocA family oxidoreductase [Caldalkalibacillus salinus]